VARTPYRYTSDFYDPNFTIQLFVGDELRSLTWGPLAFTGPREVLLDFTPKNYMEMRFINGTLIDAVITGEATAVWLEKSYWETFYKPLIEAIYHAAQEAIK